MSLCAAFCDLSGWGLPWLPGGFVLGGDWGSLSLRGKLEFLAGLPSEKKALVEPELLALSELRSRNPLMFFEPYSKQSEFLRSRAFTKAFFGGNRAGKTEIGVVDDLIQCVDRCALPVSLLPFKRWDPPFHCRIVTPKYGVNEGVILPKIRGLAPVDQLLGGRFDKAYDKVNRRLRFANGSTIVFNTGDQEVDAHAGVALHRVHFDEEPAGEHGFSVFRENQSRLADFFPLSQLMFTMTPLFGMTWVFDEVWERRDESNVFCVVASMVDNPHIPREFVDLQLAGFSKEERAARVEGRFVHFHGRVLDAFSDDHLVSSPTAEHVRGLEVFVGIDPGITQAGVLWCGFDRDNSLLVFDELYPRGLGVPRIASLIREKNSFWGVDPVYVIDPSARNRSLTNAESVQGEFYRERIFPLAGQNDRVAGILQLRARLDAGTLFVSEGCVELRNEIKRWVVARDEDTERMRAKGAGGSFATVGPDHLIDPLRYVCMQRLWGSGLRDVRRERPDSWNYMAPFRGERVVVDAPLGPFS